MAKLPADAQAESAANAVNCGLNKTEVGLLVQAYRNTYSGDVRRKIIKTPLEALSNLGGQVKKKTASDDRLNGPGVKLGRAANYAAQMLLKAVNMAENAEEKALCAAEGPFRRLRDVSEETILTLNGLLEDVSLGKPGGGRAW